MLKRAKDGKFMAGPILREIFEKDVPKDAEDVRYSCLKTTMSSGNNIHSNNRATLTVQPHNQSIYREWGLMFVFQNFTLRPYIKA